MSILNFYPRVRNYWLVPMFVIALSGCGGGGKSKAVPISSLDKQSLQTRNYEASEKIVFSSVVSVFQDLGYNINSADRDSGFINATSPQVVSSSTAEKVFAGTVVQENTKVTAFIERIGKFTRLRLTFVRNTRVSEGDSIWGENLLSQDTSTDEPIYDAVLYRNAFNLVEEAIFLRVPSPSPNQSTQ